MSKNEFQSRVVVSGVGPDGKSCVVSDANTTERAATPVATLNDVLSVAAVPVPVTSDVFVQTDEYQVIPPKNGLKVLVACFPPDKEWQSDPELYSAALAATGASETNSDVAHGFHTTDTVDVITVLSGELFAVLETEEVRLLPGDTFVQRGTAHAWSNRSDGPTVAVLTMIDGAR
ncbi:cupin domain-containing protein [Gordonia polyisoprenivorans]|uniref:cupin domain-containing protein n=1 Tax=Gordonia polyisoprenivorans TaxID=84595 RepID=UPI001AD7AB37|nr:cupin domain-containing protein [Gordonia polyisoprenivorans]QTI69029.1 cupin domain-containing protein [Gordonia polyisoprenivorans]